MKVLVIRRAKANPRGAGAGDDSRRPLSEEGVAQAQGLVELFDGERIERIITSPYQRCLQTAEPLAKRRGLELESDDRLSEGASGVEALALLRSLGDTPAALCTHSDVIRKLLIALAPRVQDDGAMLRRRKASSWRLEGDLAGAVEASYRPPPTWVSDEPRRIAVLDLGSTSFHLLVGDVGPDGSIERVTRERDMLRLGALISKHARIPLADCDRVIESVLRLRDVAKAARAETLIPIATAAFREAANGRILAKLLGRILGAQVTILSGEEEARAIFSAYRRRIGLGPNPDLGIDLGGGSLEFAIGDASEVAWETTLPLGVVRLHREFAGDAVDLSARAAKRLRKRVQKGIAAVRQEVCRWAPGRCIATGGTVRSLARVVLASSPQADDTSLLGAELATPALVEIATRLQQTSHEERLTMPGMSPHRADLLPAGAAILATVLSELGLRGLSLCDWGLREGIMLDAVRALEQPG